MSDLFAHGDELRRAVIDVLPKLNFRRGQTLTKADEVTLEWVEEVLVKAAHLCELCSSPDARDYADKSGLFTDSLCDEHAYLALGPLRD